MAVSEPMAYAIFASYFGLIFTSLGFVLRSISEDVPWKRYFEGRPFLFLRVAVGALISTWWFMFSYMKWSFDNYASGHPGATIGAWLGNTALFEEAWTIVCSTPERWAISSFICTWTVMFTYIVYCESGRRGIKHPWAYMLLGQLVAVSFSTALFYTACSLRPRQHTLDRKRLQQLLVPLGLAVLTILYTPRVVGTDRFMPNLLTMHLALLVPLAIRPKLAVDTPPETEEQRSHISSLFVLAAMVLHMSTMPLFPQDLPSYTDGLKRLYDIILLHPAQSSISLDVIWSVICIACWFFTAGSLGAIVLKSTLFVATIVGLWVRHTGVNWTLAFSIIPIVGLFAFSVITMALSQTRGKNDAKRKVALQKLGIVEENVVPGTDKKPPSFAPRRTVIGFWHPFCNAGGGGERVLWTGIAHLQRVHPDVVSLVYTGDYPHASKEEILGKIKERFSIALSAETLHFIPLRSRHLVDDGYWKRFTLLGQSLGSIKLVWEGLTGPDGFWGDIFVDTMGYAFTLPFVRLITGDEVTIGTYTHYPTVSADMVARVKARSYGVENAGASTSWLRTQIKLIYYRIFTSLYAFSLLFSEFSMTNSSWTQAHLTSLLTKGRNGVLAFLFLMDETALQKNGGEKAACEVVFPPCDTGALTGFKLDGRSREIVSLAQFRPEKEHWKQIEALATLFERHPDQRAAGVKLVLMGGARHPADEKRVEELRQLARDRGVEDAVEFVVNAPYGTVVDRLGKASVGLNTMQDEHFGINVVEFMAAGLIPVVHASAGPLMDIVVPHNGQRTGFHAKTPEEFADALYQALSLSDEQATRMRKAARALAVEKFSEKRFDEGWEKGWKVLTTKSAAKRRLRQE